MNVQDLRIRKPVRKPTLAEENLENLHVANISGPEWTIFPGNTQPEHIPASLKMGSRGKKTRRRSRGGAAYERPTYLTNTATPNTRKAYWQLLPKGQPTTNARNTLVRAIQKKYNRADYHIPVGTRLYRSALEADPHELFVAKKDMFFFGLDAYISVWYALEMWQMFRKNRHSVPYAEWYTYMHEYEVVAPIPYKYLPDLATNPKNAPYKDICLREACVHPQRIPHGAHGVLDEVGTELTLPYTFPVFQHIKPVATHTVNLIKLLEMQDYLTDMEHPFALTNVLTTRPHKNHASH